MTHAAIRIIQEEHSAVAAMLQSLLAMLREGPGDEPERFFDVVRAMLFYIDEFPERLHHPKESDMLFPRLGRVRPDLLPVIHRLEADHMKGEPRVRELQHQLMAWELVGDSRRGAFEQHLREYVQFYLEHMSTEESQILPAAQQALTAEDWDVLDAAFGQDRDPLAGGVRDPHYDRLFSRIVRTAPAPIGVGRPIEHTPH